MKQSNCYNFNFQYNEPFKISFENPEFENVKKCGLKESMEKLKKSRTQCLYTFNSTERNEEIKDFINPFDSDILYNYNLTKNYESSKFIEKAKEIDGKVQREIDEITRKLSEITNNDDYITNQQNKQIVSEIDHVIFNLKQSNQLDKSFSLDQIQKDELVEIVRKILFTFDSKRDINDPVEIDVIHEKQRKSIERFDNFNDKNNKNIENFVKFEELSDLVKKITNDFKLKNEYLRKFDQLPDKEAISMYNSDEEKSLKSEKNSRHESFLKIKSSPLKAEIVKRYSLPNNLDSKSKFKSEKLQKLNEKMDLILSKQNNNKKNTLISEVQKNDNENNDNNIENSKNMNKEVEIINEKKNINLHEELIRERGKTENWNINNNKIKNNRYSVGKIELNEIFPVFTNNKKEEITLKDAEEEEEDEPIIEKFKNKRDSYLVQMNRFQNKKEKEEIKEFNNADEKIEEENENDDFNAKKWDDFVPTKNKKQKRGSYFVQLKKKKKKRG